jgi:hypothetical protein
MLDGLALGVGQDTMTRLARFGLALTGEPLLQPRENRD